MAVRGVGALQEELDKAKQSLKGVDETIKKLTGRDPGDGRGPMRRGRDEVRGGGMGRGRIFGAARRSITEEPSPAANRRLSGGSAFGRLGPRVAASRLRPNRRPDSGDEEEFGRKPALQSSVVATPQDSHSRQDKIEEENKDGAGKQRNRRMFGLLLGTLRRFKDDEKLKGDKEKQRKAIENKLEEKATEEKEELKRERMSLFNERRSKQAKLRRLEQKMELVDIHEEWENQTQKLMHFIRTKAKPPLYYLPKSHTTATEKKMGETSKILEEIIVDRRKQLEEEIEELTKEQEEKGEGEGNVHEMDLSREERREDEEEEGEEGEEEERTVKRDRRVIDDTDQRVVQMEAEEGGDEDKENGEMHNQEEGLEREGEKKSSRPGPRKGEGDEREVEVEGEDMGGDEAMKPEDHEAEVSKGSRQEADTSKETPQDEDLEVSMDMDRSREPRKERKRHRKESSRSTDDHGEGDKGRKRKSSSDREGGSHRRERKRDHSESERKRDHSESRHRDRDRDRKEHKKRRKEHRKSRTSSASDTEGPSHVKEIPKDPAPLEEDKALQVKEPTPEKSVVEPSETQPMTEEMQQAPSVPLVALEDIEMPKDARNVVSSTLEEN